MKLVTTVDVGNCSVLRACYLHRCSNERFAIGIHELSLSNIVIGSCLFGLAFLYLNELSLDINLERQSNQELAYGIGSVLLLDVGCHLVVADVAVVVVNLEIARLLLDPVKSGWQRHVVAAQRNLLSLR